ncbi:MAG: GMC family oxidoreductase [Panacagrimonas sp.]
MQTFDYVIVGAGAAGCVLANRLSEDGHSTVALLEAGPEHKHPLITMPKGIGKVLFDRKYTWECRSQPEAATDGQSENWIRGKVLGGSSSVNGLMWVRGQPADFDALAAQSSEDWSWKHIGAAYRALESHELGAAETRGANGPLHVTLSLHRDRLTEAMIEAGVAMGLPRKQDVNAPDNAEGIGYAARTILDGRRVSGATAFLDPIRSRPNLSIVTGATADRVLFERRDEQQRATGVEVIHKGARTTWNAKRELIICGGALSSPALLQRSGIGPAKLMQELGIEPIADLPVGHNLAEHRVILLQWKLREALSQNASFAGLRLLGITAEYFLKHTGPMATGAYEIGAWLKTRPELERPDIQFLVAPFSFDLPSGRKKLETFPGIHICAYPLRPASRGELTITSRDPNEPPRLVPNYHSEEGDRRTAIDLLKVARRYVAQSPLRELIAEETYPGPACTADADVLAAYAKYGTCGFHAIGTCRMGRDAASVVDPELRVRGVQGLRVVDTSVFPEIPSGNTNGPTMAMAWRAADVIRRAT